MTRPPGVAGRWQTVGDSLGSGDGGEECRDKDGRATGEAGETAAGVVGSVEAGRGE